MIRKIGLYILSLWLLFLFIIVITVDIPLNFSIGSQFIGIKALLSRNIIPALSFVLLLLGIGSYQKFKFDLKGTTNIPFQITKIESINYEHLTFLATYVIPLICFDFVNIRYIIVLFLLLIVMGAIYIKTDLFYANPSLALLGFQIYRADGNFKSNTSKCGIILISRDKLSKEQRVKYIKLDERIYFVKGI